MVVSLYTVMALLSTMLTYYLISTDDSQEVRDLLTEPHGVIAIIVSGITWPVLLAIVIYAGFKRD